MNQNYIKECKFCGKEFSTTYSFQVYCSPKCRNQRRIVKREQPVLDIKKCTVCSKKFWTKQVNQRFCSSNCRIKYYHQKQEKMYHYYWQVLNRDNFSCQYCGRNPTEHSVVLVIDHIKPKADGGKETLDNLVTACNKCNLLKSNRPLRHEAKFKKRFEKRSRFISSQTAFNFYLRPENEEFPP